MVNEYLTRAYDTKVIFRELLCFYAPFGWVPVKENRAPSPNPPVHKMYDGNTVWSMEKQDYVSDYDVGRKKSEKIVVKRNTKFTRNNRLMTEEALMEYHLRFRYWLYPRCNRLRLINRCRPVWGSLWALLFLIFLFFHLTVCFGGPMTAVGDMGKKAAKDFSGNYIVRFEVTDSGVYALDKQGPYFKVNTDNGVILVSSKANGEFAAMSEEEQDEYGVQYNTGSNRLSFSKDANKKALNGKTKYKLYKVPTEGVFVEIYNLFVGVVDNAFDKAATGLLNILCYVFGAIFFVLLMYQLNSNWWLKKNTERIIACCVNAKAIVTAMQYEDITLMNGRQRQRYYQGQVINEAARNTGDPLYFGS